MSKGRATRVLRRAHDLLGERRRWTKGDYKEPAGYIGPDEPPEYAWMYCWVGAVREAADLEGYEQHWGGAEREQAVSWAYRLCAQQVEPNAMYGSREDVMIRFNDAEQTTYEQVIERLEKALKVADDQGL